MDKSRNLNLFICLLASLFPMYAYMQMDILNVLNPTLMALSLSKIEIGLLFSGYLYAVAVCLIPAGVLLDKYNEKHIILFAIMCMIIGIMLFSYAKNYKLMLLSRVISAIGHSFSIISCLRIISKKMESCYIGIASGIMMTMAMIGSVISQLPAAYLIENIGWRQTLFVIGCFGIIIFVIYYKIIDTNDYKIPINKFDLSNIAKKILISIRSFIRTPNILISAGYMCLITCPTAWLSELWGVTFLKSSHNLTIIKASFITSMLYIGAILGSPVMGFISDVISRRKPVMIFGSFFVSLFIVIIFKSHLNFYFLSFIFFFLGIFASTYSLGYAVVIESSDLHMFNTSLAVTNVIIVLGVSTFLNLYSIHDSSVINGGSYAYVLLFAGSICSLVLSIFLKETFCKRSFS